MKRSESSDLLYPSKIIKTAPELPVEIWHEIFALTTFDDQLNCRETCVRWRDLIATLPDFKNKICLILGYSSLLLNEPPLSHAKFPVASLKFTKMYENLKFYPNFPTFLLRISETLTHLDISNNDLEKSIYENRPIDSNIFRMILENLRFFKVLKHLEIDSLIAWLRTINFRTPVMSVFNGIVASVLEEHSGSMTYESVKRYLEDEQLNHFRQNTEVIRYRHILIEKIVKNVNVSADKTEVEKAIIAKVRDAIDELDKIRDLYSKINTSVQKVSFKGRDEFIDPEKLLVLVPNVQEIILSSSSYYAFIGLVEKMPSKITAFTIKDPYNILTSRSIHQNSHLLCNLKHLNFSRGADIEIKKVDRLLNLFPTLQTITGYADHLGWISDRHFPYITKLDIEVNDERAGLCKLVEFKKLQTLKVRLHCGNIKDNYLDHVFYHFPVTLDSIEKFDLHLASDAGCVQCIESLLQSMRNLRYLKLRADFNRNFERNVLDAIFKFQSRLETLKIHNFNSLPFEPNDQWPEMKRLRYLEIHFTTIGGNKASWNSFGKKLQRLKYLSALAGESVDLEQMIGTNMPALQSVRVSQCYEYEKPKLVLRGKNKYMLEEAVQ